MMGPADFARSVAETRAYDSMTTKHSVAEIIQVFQGLVVQW